MADEHDKQYATDEEIENDCPSCLIRKEESDDVFQNLMLKNDIDVEIVEEALSKLLHQLKEHNEYLPNLVKLGYLICGHDTPQNVLQSGKTDEHITFTCMYCEGTLRKHIVEDAEFIEKYRESNQYPF